MRLVLAGSSPVSPQGSSQARAWGTHPTTATRKDASRRWDQRDTKDCCNGRFFTAELLDLLAKGLMHHAWFAQMAPGNLHIIKSGLKSPRLISRAVGRIKLGWPARRARL